MQNGLMRFNKSPQQTDFVVIYPHKMCGSQAVHYLEGAGYRRFHDFWRGVAGWACGADPAMRRY
jgi:hypothetical protein